LSEAKVVTWTRINPKVFFLQEEPVCTNDDSFVMEPTPEADYKYLQAVATLVLSKTDYGWTKKAGKNVIKNFEVPIPKPVGDYSSLELQKILIDFSGIITSHYSKLKSMLADLKIKIQTYVSTTIHKTFKEQI
ncbi:MAG: hypothetical protein ACPG5P_07085, partial [Saprospiraceae bacterium]